MLKLKLKTRILLEIRPLLTPAFQTQQPKRNENTNSNDQPTDTIINEEALVEKEQELDSIPYLISFCRQVAAGMVRTFMDCSIFKRC